MNFLIQILGIILSGIISLFIAHFYYKRATKDLKMETSNLTNLNRELKSLLSNLEELESFVMEDTDVIRKTVTKNTSNDPDYPYK